VHVYSSMYWEALSYEMLGRSCGTHGRLKSRLVSVTCCSEIDIFCLRCMCMNRGSQQFIFMPFLQQGFNIFDVSSAEPNSCLLSETCVAYADVWNYCWIIKCSDIIDAWCKHEDSSAIC